MYIGSIVETEEERLMIVNETLEYQTIKYNPGLWKIIDEIFANSLDEAIRTNFKFATNITVTFNRDSVTISDDGRGVPQTIADNGLPMAVNAFTMMMTGTNFSEETKADASIGTNGVGSFATNVFSKEFIVDTYDGMNHLNLHCKNNMDEMNHTVRKSKTSCGTTIKFKPDFERFSIIELDDVYPIMMANLMTHLAQVFPIKFTLINNIQSTSLGELF